MKKVNFNVIDEGVFEEQLREISIDIVNQKMYTGKVRTLKDFSKKEIKNLEKLYKCKILLPKPILENSINVRRKANNNKRRVSKKGSRSRRNTSKSR